MRDSKGDGRLRNRLPSEALEDQMVEVLRQKTGAERLEIAFGMFRSARDMLHSHLSAEHPDWSEEQVSREVARRISHGAA